jgi:tripartite-type tricarboxylate transporter receptor subunit TctC
MQDARSQKDRHCPEGTKTTMIRLYLTYAVADSFCLIPLTPYAQPAAASAARAYPVKPIRILVGPGPDALARTLGQKLTEAWSQQIVVDQRPGAGGNMAAEIAAKSPADGYTLLVATASFAANVVLQPGPFDLVKDFSPIALLATSPLILVVHPSVPAKSLQEFIALAKAEPGQLNYACTGNGTAPHLAMEMLKAAAKLDVVQRINGMGWEPAGTTGNTPDTMGQFLKAEIAKFARIARENNLKAD